MAPIDSIVARLTSLHPKRIDLSLDRVQRLLAALGHPEKKLPPVIHVAGTNGKGSTVAFLRAILEAAGKRVHTYTSPHLVRFNERFRVGDAGEGRLVSDEELAAAMEECERANANAPSYSSIRVPRTFRNCASHAGCAGQAGAVTRLPQVYAWSMPISTYFPPAWVTSGATAG